MAALTDRHELAWWPFRGRGAALCASRFFRDSHCPVQQRELIVQSPAGGRVMWVEPVTGGLTHQALTTACS
ncbi:MAG TPA: hypothetical protein VIO81_16780 [Methyloversatilis sp.]